MKYAQVTRGQFMNAGKVLTKGRLAAVMLLLVVLASCQFLDNGDRARAEAAAKEQQRLAGLLAQGQAALQQDKLSAPENDNAVFYFREVLASSPDNADAKAGLDAVFNRYLDRARDAHNASDFVQALTLVDEAEKILPPSSLSQTMRTQILEEQARAAVAKAKKQAAAPRERVEYKLDPDSLTNRDDKIQERLKRIAEHVRTVKGTIRIDARTDTEGKWILEQLKQDEPQYNFHRDLHKSAVPKIVLWMPET